VIFPFFLQQLTIAIFNPRFSAGISFVEAFKK